MEEYTYTVPELSAQIARTISRAFREEVWLRGEIRNLNRARSGHVYFSLVDPADPTESQVPVTLFNADREVVNRILIRSGAIRMTDGVEIRVRGAVQHYGPRGTVQLRMTSIDPEFTMGRLAAERARVLEALAKADLLDRNASLPIPVLPLRIGLLTSARSAAEADFIETLRAGRYGFRLEAVDVQVQGEGAAASLTAGLALLQSRRLDLIAIVRGGGAATDLAVFDQERLARAIATCRLPVFTGIGHQTDESIADRVAARSFKTPTDCAHALVSAADRFERRLTQADTDLLALSRRALESGRQTVGRLAERAANAAGHRLSAATARVSRAGGHLAGLARLQTRSATRDLDRANLRLAQRSRAALERAAAATVGVEGRLALADPQLTLRRGWSLTRAAGTVIRSVAEISPGQHIEVELADGALEATVTGILSREATTPEEGNPP